MLIGKRPPALQVGAVCLDPATGKVLLITSRGTGRWIIPKGWPMEGMTLPGAAAREAWEEAGVEGRVGLEELGRYSYQKDDDSGFAIAVEVRVFPLHVSRSSSEFPESDQRRRRWFPPHEAARLVAEPGLRRILASMTDAPGHGRGAVDDSRP
ncbi:NUDIX hydrolase [Paracoccus sp. EGI L200073]|nr:NUDIX hydrolase [Paracoccus salsus]